MPISKIGTNSIDQSDTDLGLTGNVGIGTSSPTYKLDVLGDVKVGASGNILLVDGNPTTSYVVSNGNATTGVYYGNQANAPTIFMTGNSERMRIDSSGNVGIGTASPSAKFNVTGTSVVANIESTNNNNVMGLLFNGTVGGYLGANGTNLIFSSNNGTERMRIDANGNLLVGRTSAYGDGSMGTPLVQCGGISGTRVGLGLIQNSTAVTGAIGFANPNGFCGSINTSGTTTSYNTSSDYRLKENVTPITEALEKVSKLNPVNWTWKSDGSDGQGFIAHELQAVVPDCVTGEKDAVDAEGNPVYQGVDTSFLVATLTAAIKEQQETIESLKARIEALENK